jgi:hypothetical protein
MFNVFWVSCVQDTKKEPSLQRGTLKTAIKNVYIGSLDDILQNSTNI